jgi:restriction endonuclease S subunit
MVEPAFLAWAINQAPAQKHFDNAACGSNLRMVPRSSLDTLDIDIPDLATQRIIVAINELSEREQALTVLKAEKRNRMISLMLLDQANKHQIPTEKERNSDEQSDYTAAD